jgi:hypothetical protein
VPIFSSGACKPGNQGVIRENLPWMKLKRLVGSGKEKKNSLKKTVLSESPSLLEATRDSAPSFVQENPQEADKTTMEQRVESGTYWTRP